MTKEEEVQNVGGIHATLESVNMSLWASINRLEEIPGTSKARRKVEQAQRKVADAVIHLVNAMEQLEGE